MKKLIALALSFVMLGSVCNEALAAVMTLPKKVQTIDERAFYGDTSMDEVVMPYGSENIGELAFAYSGLKRITIPNTVSSIADNAFEGITGLTIAAPAGSKAQEYAEAEAQTARGFVWEDSTGSDRQEAYADSMAKMQERLAQIETSEEQESIALVGLDTASIPTDNVENPALLGMLESLNALNQRIEEAAETYQADLHDMGMAVGELAELLNPELEEASAGKLDFSSEQMGSFAISGDVDFLLSGDYEVLESAASQNEAIQIQLKKGTSVYLLALSTGSISVQKGAASRGNNARGLTARASEDEVDESFFQNLSRTNAMIEAQWKTVWEKCRDGFDRLEGKLEAEKKELDRLWDKAAAEGLDDPRFIDGFEKTSKNVGKIYQTVERLRPLIKMMDGINPVVSGMQIVSDLISWRNLQTFKGHGHATTLESCVPALAATAKIMQDDISVAQWSYGCDAFFSAFDCVTSICTWISTWSAAAGQLELAIPAALANAISKIGKEMGKKGIQKAMLAAGISSAISTAEADRLSAKIRGSDKEIHDAYGKLTGRVVDQDGNPIENVVVTVRQDSPDTYARTDSEGKYEFNLPGASWDLVFEGAGYRSTNKTFWNFSGQETQAEDVTMERLFGKVSGVVCKKNGEPLEGVTVYAGDPDMIMEGVTFTLVTDTTDAQGRYTLEKVLPGPAQIVTFKMENYKTQKPTVEVLPDETAVLSPVLEHETGTLYGTIIDAVTKIPLSDVTITYDDITATATNGKYTLTLPAGEEQVITFSRDEYKPRVFNITMDPGETAEHSFALTPRIGWLTGKVIEEGTKKPIDKAIVHCGDYTAVTIADGSFTIEGEDGSYILEAEYPDYSSYRYRATIHGGETTPLAYDVMVRPLDGKITGVVRDAGTGAPINGAEVYVGERYATTKSDGIYTLKVPSDASYTLNVYADGYYSGRGNVSVPGQGEATLDFYLEAQTGAIGGVVRDEDTNAAISGVTVTCGDKTATTNSQGVYTLEDVPVGTRSVTFRMSGYAAKGPQTVEVKVNQTASLNVSLKKNTYAILDFSAYDAETNEKVSIPVIIKVDGKDDACQNSGDKDYRLILSAGKHTISFKSTYYKQFSITISVKEGDEIKRDFYLDYDYSATDFYNSITVTETGFPESKHPYDKGTDKTWEYIAPTKTRFIEISFSEKTALSPNYSLFAGDPDKIIIYNPYGSVMAFEGYRADEEHSSIGWTYLSGNTITIRGDRFKIRLRHLSADVNTYYGFRITNIKTY